MSGHKPTIAVMLPGEIFSRKWVHAWTNLIVSTLAGGYDLAPLFGFSSSPHTTRSALALTCLNAPANIQVDFVLWIDDDNIVLPAHLNKLLSILQSRPDVDVAGGWCWIEGDPESGRAPRVSCGTWGQDYTQHSFSADAMQMEAQRGKLMIANWTGFPVLLMRPDVLRKTGPHPFAGIPGDQFLHGMSGEDIAFCIRAEQAGCVIVIDPTVKVEHLKVQPVADPPKRRVIDLSAPAPKKWRISVCHTSARPHAWKKAHDLFRKNAAGKFEYVLCVDERWGFPSCPTVGFQPFSLRGPDKVVWNRGRKCAVSGWNTAFGAATGDLLLMGSDDVFPCEHWDALLLEAMAGRDPLKEDFAIRINTNNPNQGRDLFPTVISRARYQRLGYALYPEYDCYASDDDDCEHILQDVRDGLTTLIDARGEISFAEENVHLHNAPNDPVYQHQYRQEAARLGVAILGRRRHNRFQPLEPLPDIDLSLAGARASGEQEQEQIQ